jgi:NADH-quinone oxidoreductase subunit L
MALAAGAVVAGFAGIPAALGGSNWFEHFLAPTFAGHGLEAPAAEHMSVAAELGLMLVSVTVAAAGILTARHIYESRAGLAESLAERWRSLHRLLLNKYYVDEIYDATVVRATTSGAHGLWRIDAVVVDGFVNAWGWLTRVAAWVSHMFDKYIVDGLVNLLGWSAGEGSYAFRRVQTGLVQNYALMMLGGVFVLLTVYLLAG